MGELTAVRLAGAVLTGGASTRMGSDKALVRVDGVPMAGRVADVLGAVGCAPVAFVGGDADSLIHLGGMFVADATPGQGPAGGVVAALRALAGDVDAVVIAACDLAFLTPAQLVPLIDVLRRDGDRDGDGDGDGLIDVAVARTAERVQPLCAVWRSSAGATVQASFDAGVRSVFGLLDALRVEEVEVAADGLRNINSPADLGAGPAQH